MTASRLHRTAKLGRRTADHNPAQPAEMQRRASDFGGRLLDRHPAVFWHQERLFVRAVGHLRYPECNLHIYRFALSCEPDGRPLLLFVR